MSEIVSQELAAPPPASAPIEDRSVDGLLAELGASVPDRSTCRLADETGLPQPLPRLYSKPSTSRLNGFSRSLPTLTT